MFWPNRLLLVLTGTVISALLLFTPEKPSACAQSEKSFVVAKPTPKTATEADRKLLDVINREIGLNPFIAREAKRTQLQIHVRAVENGYVSLQIYATGLVNVVQHHLLRLDSEITGSNRRRINAEVEVTRVSELLKQNVIDAVINNADSSHLFPHLRAAHTLEEWLRKVPEVKAVVWTLPPPAEFARLLAIEANALQFSPENITYNAVRQMQFLVRIAQTLDPKVELPDRAATVVTRQETANNLKMIGLALHNYHDVYRVFPPGHIHVEPNPPQASWLTMLLPFVEQQDAYELYNFNLGYNAVENTTITRMKIKTYLAPDYKVTANAQGFGVTHFVAVGTTSAGHDLVKNPSGIFGLNSRINMRDILDGTSNTLLAGQIAEAPPAWAGHNVIRSVDMGINKNLRNGFGSKSGNGASFLFADGRVQFLHNNVDVKVLKAMATRRGKEVFDPVE